MSENTTPQNTEDESYDEFYQRALKESGLSKKKFDKEIYDAGKRLSKR
ncbi:MAG: hypothetical protein NTX00_04415 [Candidatus Parcubacteria bacterium]|nr:hypothetical protein [Candidatus Parcubacteria bacterium]